VSVYDVNASPGVPLVWRDNNMNDHDLAQVARSAVLAGGESLGLLPVLIKEYSCFFRVVVRQWRREYITPSI
jgi:hypothetical protein